MEGVVKLGETPRRLNAGNAQQTMVDFRGWAVISYWKKIIAAFPGRLFFQTMPERSLSPRTSQLCLAIFVLALLAHGWMVTRNWKAGFMPGHEFRQAQTAIISDYIDRDN